jgi:hypothetical protein
MPRTPATLIIRGAFMGRGGYASKRGPHNDAGMLRFHHAQGEGMTPDQRTELNEALNKITELLGIAGEASTLGKKKDVERALQQAMEEMKKCREILGRADKG